MAPDAAIEIPDAYDIYTWGTYGITSDLSIIYNIFDQI